MLYRRVLLSPMIELLQSLRSRLTFVVIYPLSRLLVLRTVRLRSRTRWDSLRIWRP